MYCSIWYSKAAVKVSQPGIDKDLHYLRPQSEIFIAVSMKVTDSELVSYSGYKEVIINLGSWVNVTMKSILFL